MSSVAGRAKRLAIGVAVVVSLAATLMEASPARAGLTGEVDRGQRLSDALRSGDQRCSDLSAADFELVGEYAMDRVIGNRAAHEAMNQHMVQMIGEAGERRMHMALGYRYAGCAGAPASNWLGPMAGMMGRFGGGSGPGMMGGYGGPNRYFGMVRTGSHENGDLSGPAIAALAFGAAVLGGLLVAFALHRGDRRPRVSG